TRGSVPSPRLLDRDDQPGARDADPNRRASAGCAPRVGRRGALHEAAGSADGHTSGRKLARAAGGQMKRIGVQDVRSQAGRLEQEVGGAAEQRHETPVETYERAQSDGDPSLGSIKQGRLALAEAIAEYNRLREAGQPELDADRMMVELFHSTRRS